MEFAKAGQREVETLTSDEHKRIKNAMEYRFGAYLRPGESIAIDAEKAALRAILVERGRCNRTVFPIA